METLRDRVLKLAQENPELRHHLVPLLRESSNPMNLFQQHKMVNKPHPKPHPKPHSSPGQSKPSAPSGGGRSQDEMYEDSRYDEELEKFKAHPPKEYADLKKKHDEKLKEAFPNGTQEKPKEMPKGYWNELDVLRKEVETTGDRLRKDLKVKVKEDIQKEDKARSEKQKAPQPAEKQPSFMDRVKSLFNSYKDKHPDTKKTPQDFAEDLKKDGSVRTEMLRLAHEQPKLRSLLLPLIR